MYSIKLEWKEHSIDLEGLEVWLRANGGDLYCGNSADAALTLWFSEEPSQEIKDAMSSKWDALDDESNELCTSYKSSEERQAEKVAAKQAAITALAVASGLSQDQVEALLS